MNTITSSILLRLFVACGVLLLGSAILSPAENTAHAQNLCPGQNYQFFEENGLVIIEAESQPAAGDWQFSTAINGFTGTGYHVWTGPNLGGSPGSGLIEYKIRINNPGTYRFYLRSRITEGDAGDLNNDMWLKFPDAEGFFGFRESDNSFVYPRGNGRGPNGTDQTPYPNGGNADGWFKIFMNRVNAWHWQATTSDNDAHQVFVQFDRVATYTMQVSGRSTAFGIDRMVLYDEDLYTEDSIERTSRPETDCNGNPPLSVLNTNPRNNESDFPRNRNIELTFSESVTVSGRWFRITCPPTDVLFNVDNTVVTQNQNEFTFNPNEGLPSGFTCEFFINSNGVRDGSGNLLANNYTFRFTTSGSAAPVLTNITPADGAENVPINANVQLTWNEPVTTTDNWFEINCAPGGLRVRPGESSVTGSGANRTINPNENFTAGDECSIDLRSGRIRDADDNALFGGSVTYTFTIGAPESADIEDRKSVV